MLIAEYSSLLSLFVPFFLLPCFLTTPHPAALKQWCYEGKKLPYENRLVVGKSKGEAEAKE